MGDVKEMARQGLQKAQEDGVVKAENAAAVDLRTQLEQLIPRLAEASIRKLPPEFIISTAMTLMRANEKLRECTPLSVVHGILQSAQLGLRLDPALGHATLVPRRNRRTGQYEAQFMPMYKGLLLRAQRTGKVVEVVAQPVYANDTFTYSYGTNRTLEHKPATGARGDIVAFYAYARLANGGFQFEVMSVDDVTGARDRGGYREGDRNSPWVTDFVAMGRKTVLKRLLQLLPVEDTLLNDAVRLDDMAEHGVPQEIDVDADGEVVYNATWQKAEPEVPAIEEPPACVCNDMSKLGEVCPLHGAPKNVPIAETPVPDAKATDGPLAAELKATKARAAEEAARKKLEETLGPLEPVGPEQAAALMSGSQPAETYTTVAGQEPEWWYGTWALKNMEKVQNRADAVELWRQFEGMQKRGQLTDEHMVKLAAALKDKLTPPAEKKRKKKASRELFDEQGNPQP